MYQMTAKPQTEAKNAQITPTGVLSGISIGWYFGSSISWSSLIAVCLRVQ